jgi:anti-anti-sigma regulatory factor
MSYRSDATVRISLSGPFTKAALAPLRAALAGCETLTLDIDALPALDAPAIANLVTLLRDARNRGVALRLAVSRSDLLETLRVTGLDIVFALAPDPSAVSSAPPALRAAAATKVAARRRGRLLGALFALLAFALFAAASFGSGSRALAQNELAPALTPAQIIAKITEQNPSMLTYQARVAVNFRLKSFPYFSQHLDGTTYFKRPDNFEVVFDRVPSYARGFEKMYSDIGDPTNWHKRFEIARDGERVVAGHRDIVLRLTLIQRGMIDREIVLVDPVKWHIDEMIWSYYNGGQISMTQDFRQEGEFAVLAAQHATIRIPHISAAAEASYSDYHTNVAIDDSVFTKAH